MLRCMNWLQYLYSHKDKYFLYDLATGGGVSVTLSAI